MSAAHRIVDESDVPAASDWSPSTVPLATSTPPRAKRNEGASLQPQRIQNYKLFGADDAQLQAGRPLSDSHVEQSGRLKESLRQKTSRVFQKLSKTASHVLPTRNPKVASAPVEHYPQGLYVHTRAGGTTMMLMRGLQYDTAQMTPEDRQRSIHLSPIVDLHPDPRLAYCYEAPPEDPNRFVVLTAETEWIKTFLDNSPLDYIQRQDLVGRADTVLSYLLTTQKFVELYQKIKEQYGESQQMTAWVRKDADRGSSRYPLAAS